MTKAERDLLLYLGRRLAMVTTDPAVYCETISLVVAVEKESTTEVVTMNNHPPVWVVPPKVV